MNLSLPGLHNVYNAVAVWTVMCSLNFSASDFGQSLSSFRSTARRFQLIKQFNSTYYFDDYAHHPTEIAATLTACKAQFPHSKLIAIFQPHTFSRTQALLTDFATAFTFADVLILTPIFGSARESTGSITPTTFASAITINPTNTTQVIIAESLAEAAQIVRNLDTSNSIIITLGAGDVYTLHNLLDQETKT